MSCHKHLVSLEIVIFGTAEYEAKHVAKRRWKHCPVCTLVKLSLIVHSPLCTEIYNNSYIITSHRCFLQWSLMFSDDKRVQYVPMRIFCCLSSFLFLFCMRDKKVFYTTALCNCVLCTRFSLRTNVECYLSTTTTYY